MQAEQPSRSKARNTKDIWDDDEVPDTPQTGAEDDPRPQPELVAVETDGWTLLMGFTLLALTML